MKGLEKDDTQEINRLQAACGSPTWIVFVVSRVFYFMDRVNFQITTAHDCGNVTSIVYDPYLNKFKLASDSVNAEL